MDVHVMSLDIITCDVREPERCVCLKVKSNLKEGENKALMILEPE